MITIALLIALITSPLFAPTPLRTSPMPAPLAAPAPNPNIGQTIEVTYTPKDGSPAITGTLVVTRAYQGRFNGYDGIVISGNLHLPIAADCQGFTSPIGSSRLPVIIDPLGIKNTVIGLKYLQAEEPYLIRSITSFTCHKP